MARPAITACTSPWAVEASRSRVADAEGMTPRPVDRSQSITSGKRAGSVTFHSRSSAAGSSWGRTQSKKPAACWTSSVA